MKKITCISYHGTGSGAVDDYLREFEAIAFAKSEVECRFLQDPDGISDLQYNLVDNWHRLNSGFALKRYRKFAKKNRRTYRLIFGKAWDRETEKYLSRLTAFKFEGYWHADINEQPFFFWAVFKIRRLIDKVSPFSKRTQDYNYFPYLKSVHSAVNEDDFLQITRDYCEALCSSLKKGNTNYVVLDQCVPTTNTSRYLQYIKDLKVILVDRDPRDVYIQAMNGNTHVLPHNIEYFISQYRDSRRFEKDILKDKNILRIQFEDLIFKYDSTTEKIRDFLGLDEKMHTKKNQYFKPEISMKNTRLWISNEKYKDEIARIEEMLPEFLYGE